MWTNFRLKFRRFLRKYKNIILVIIIIWLIVFAINKYLQFKPMEVVAETSYTPQTSVLDSSSKAPDNVHSTLEEYISTYVDACNEGNYQKAFDLLSDDCKKYEYNDNLVNFMAHIYNVLPFPKVYSIQDYSNYKVNGITYYIYEIKYTQDYLATGFDESDYSFSSEKVAIYEKDDEYNLNVGDFIYYTESIKGMTENEYLKVDTISKLVEYNLETYKIRLTNKSEYTIVIADNQESEEIVLNLPQDTRGRTDRSDVVLKPGESKEITVAFSKFVDDNQTSQDITFPAIRIMEKYSGTDVDDAVIEDEINNAIAKFSMSVGIIEKE